ncbi:MAG: carboxypeptidase regulatory-like domain-containing protein, partial [Bacillota bacterium]
MFRWILKKKSLHWVVLLALLVGIFPAPANVGATTGDNTGVVTPQTATGPEVSLEASKKLVRPGEAFDVYLTVSDAAYLVGGSLDLAFNPGVASFNNLWAGDLFGTVTDPVYEAVYDQLPYDEWVFEMAASVGENVYGDLYGAPALDPSVANNVYNTQGAAVVSYAATVYADRENQIYPYANAGTDGANLVTLTFTAQNEGLFPLDLLANTTGIVLDSLNSGTAMAKFSQAIPRDSEDPPKLNFAIQQSDPVLVVDASAVGYVFVDDMDALVDDPVAGVRVEVLQSGSESIVATVYTDEAGRYLLPANLTSVDLYGEGSFDLRFSKDGFKTVVSTDNYIYQTELTKIDDAWLPADRAITGVVKDGSTSQPLAGVAVAVYVYGVEEPVAVTTSGVDGHYLIGPLNSETEYDLIFSAEGYNDQEEYVYVYAGSAGPWDADDVYMYDDNPYFEYFEPSMAIADTSIPLAVYGGNFGTSVSSVTISVYRSSPWEESGSYGPHDPVYMKEATVDSVSVDQIDATIDGLTAGWYTLGIKVNGMAVNTHHEEIEVRPAGIGAYSWTIENTVLSPGYPEDYFYLDESVKLYNTAGTETFQLGLSLRDSDVLLDDISLYDVPDTDVLYYNDEEQTWVDYTIPVGIPKGTYQKWLVVNSNTKVFIGYLVVGEPSIDWISPQPVPNKPGAELYLEGYYLGDDSSTTFHVYNDAGYIATITPERAWGPYGTHPEPLESDFDLKLPQMNFAPGNYTLVAQVYGERSLPFPFRIENGHFLTNWTKQPPVFKAGVNSFTIFLGGYLLDGTTYTAKLLKPVGEGEMKTVATGSGGPVGEKMGKEFIQLDFQSVEGQIPAGHYFIKVEAADGPVRYLDATWNGLDVEFLDNPVVYEVRPDVIQQQRANQEINILGWNLGSDTYKISVSQDVYNGVTQTVYATPVTTVVYGTNFNIEYLPVTLPALPGGKYKVTVTSSAYGQVEQWGFDDLRLYVEDISAGVYFPFEPWGASIVTREVYHDGDVYYADAFDISNIATWGIDWNNNTATAELWRWDGKPAVLGEQPIQA